MPSSAPMADFSLVMVPAIAAPCALLLHIYAVCGVLLGAGAGSNDVQTGRRAIA